MLVKFRLFRLFLLFMKTAYELGDPGFGNATLNETKLSGLLETKLSVLMESNSGLRAPIRDL